VDKLAKIGRDETGKLLGEIAGEGNAAQILRSISPAESFEETLRSVTELAGGEAEDTERLKILRKYMIDTGIEDSFEFDPSITRGLDYYTGIVYETFLKEDPSIGSVCSGGRYDNLAGLYSKDRISGVGSSIGLDRLVAALESLGKLPLRPSYAKVFIACLGEGDGGACQALAEQLRAEGIPCEVLLEGDGRQLTKQFILAEKKGGRWLIIPGEKQPGENLTLRDLGSRKNREALRLREIIDLVKRNP
jgi:histidyl-tRNA synthetase